MSKGDELPKFEEDELSKFVKGKRNLLDRRFIA